MHVTMYYFIVLVKTTQTTHKMCVISLCTFIRNLILLYRDKYEEVLFLFL